MPTLFLYIVFAYFITFICNAQIHYIVLTHLSGSLASIPPLLVVFHKVELYEALGNFVCERNGKLNPLLDYIDKRRRLKVNFIWFILEIAVILRVFMHKQNTEGSVPSGYWVRRPV